MGGRTRIDPDEHALRGVPDHGTDPEGFVVTSAVDGGRGTDPSFVPPVTLPG